VDALCEGTLDHNGFYGDGIVNAAEREHRLTPFEVVEQPARRRLGGRRLALPA
jgi:hypothetical protein